MRFSVVVPTFNRKEMLRQCLTALAAQDYPDYEVLVVDGGDDGTAEMMAREFQNFHYLSLIFLQQACVLYLQY